MKQLLLLFTLFSTSTVFATPVCDGDDILDNLIAYKMMAFQNKEYPMYLGMTLDMSKVKTFTQDCPVITSKKYPHLKLKNGMEIIIGLLADFGSAVHRADVNMKMKAGDSISDVRNKVAPILEKQLYATLRKSCDFKIFYKTFVYVNYTAATKSLGPPLPSYDGSSAEFIGFKADTGLLDKFLNTCLVMTDSNSKIFPISKLTLQSAMKKVAANAKTKPIKALGYMGGTWNEGDYYMPSEEQLRDQIDYQLFKSL